LSRNFPYERDKIIRTTKTQRTQKIPGENLCDLCAFVVRKKIQWLMKGVGFLYTFKFSEKLHDMGLLEYFSQKCKIMV